MRYETVTAHAFGPFSGMTISLKPGMNVVYGPNEAGKSSLHAAMYAALCGVRKGQGKPAADELAFMERHKPWDGTAWEVGALLHWENGRRIDLRHNLVNKTCKAVDAALGASVDVPAGVGGDKAADGSRWLGLDRRAFLATACVRQADLLGVLADPGTLDSHIQRAAATAGADATAAQALALIDKFHAENVGVNKANAVKPLRKAVERVDTAEDVLREAQDQHAGYAELVVRARELRGEVEQATHTIALVEAKRAVEQAAVVRRRAEQAAALAAHFPHGAPTGAAENDALGADVAKALHAWRIRPAVPSLSGETAETLRARLAALPEQPDGDPTPDPQILQARSALENALGSLLSEAETQDAEAPRVEDASARGGGRLPLPAPAAGSVLVVIGLGLLVAGVFAAGIAIILVGAGLLGWALLRSRGSSASSAAAAQAAREAAQAALRQNFERQRDAAAARLKVALAARGISPTGDGIAEAYAYEAACRERAAQAALAAQRPALESQLQTRLVAERTAAEASALRSQAEAELRAAAARCGVPTEGASDEALAAALDAWQKRRAQGLQASDEAQKQWTELQTLLQGETLQAVLAEAARTEAVANALTGALDRAEVQAVGVEADAEDQLRQLRDRLADLSAAHNALLGQITQVEQTTTSVPEAEDELASSRASLERVRQLDETLVRTREFLARAQDQVHRDIAPVLARDIRDSVANVTGGRYTDVLVDPSTLEVTVRDADGHWRRAAVLSRGTAEQIYLLLRASLAKRLTAVGEVCPLILDDATVHCDAARKVEILNTLWALSQERQVVLFTHEEAVLGWAEATLTGERDGIVQLAAEPVAA